MHHNARTVSDTVTTSPAPVAETRRYMLVPLISNERRHAAHTPLSALHLLGSLGMLRLGPNMEQTALP